MGRIGSLFVFARQGLGAKPFQSILMIITFGIVFGASLLALCGIRSGYNEIEKGLEQLGRDLIQVHKNPVLTFFSDPQLASGDVKLCKEAADGEASAAQAVQAVVTAAESSDSVDGTEKPKSVVLLGVDRMWPGLNRLTFASGRFVKQNEKHCCTLDAWVSKQVFGTVDAAGRKVTVRWGGSIRELTVTGVVEDPFSIRVRLQQFDVLHGARPLEFKILEGRNIYVPLSVLGDKKTVLFCLVRPDDAMPPFVAASRIRNAFGERSGKLLVWARGPWIDAVCKALDIGFIFSHSVWAIFLSIAGAMIMTISLLAVSDRAVEIGIRRTQGASRGDVCAQILVEGFIVSAAGAAAGFTAAPFVGMYLERHMFWELTIQPGSIAFVAAAGIAVTLLSFLLPAYRASRLEPVDVVRDM